MYLRDKVVSRISKQGGLWVTHKGERIFMQYTGAWKHFACFKFPDDPKSHENMYLDSGFFYSTGAYGAMANDPIFIEKFGFGENPVLKLKCGQLIDVRVDINCPGFDVLLKHEVELRRQDIEMKEYEMLKLGYDHKCYIQITPLKYNSKGLVTAQTAKQYPIFAGSILINHYDSITP